MRIVSCHIAGFGRFQNQGFDFTKNPTVIKADNGWGKTTFAAFLESMFYGLEAGRGKGVAENMRLKYEPWNGGPFGGSLTFSVDGKKYRIERTFGKTPSADTAKVYDENNMRTYVFGDKADSLGEALFRVNRESYEKTAYIPQGEIFCDGLSEDLKARLTSLLSVGGGSGCGAIERLDAAERALRAKRRPAKGKLDEIDEKLALLRRQIAERNREAEQASTVEREIAKDVESLSRVENELKNTEARIGEAANRLAAEEMQRQLSRSEAALAELSVFFKNTDPKAVCLGGLEEEIVEFYSKKKGAGTDGKKRTKWKFPLWIGLILLIFGATQIATNPVLGYILFSFGGAIALVSLFKRIRKREKPSAGGESEKKLKAFFENFGFEEIYDYRAALTMLKEKISAWEKHENTVKEYREKLSRLAFSADRAFDSVTLTNGKIALERERDELLKRIARGQAQLAVFRERAALSEQCEGEDIRLAEEKQRLEKRLSAIRAAREILLRARENTASRYLDPVEENCRNYAKILSGNTVATSEALFSADGKLLFEENGSYKNLDFYSAGTKELYGFCVRIALAESVFVAHLPPLLLDDPFVNLDDGKTESAKRLVRELSKKYQIVYFTCKSERTIGT